MSTALIFYLFAGLTVASGAMVVSARNPVHSVLWLILCFFNTAGLFLLLGAEFLAMVLVIVYVGAVAVLFLFVVMMLDVNRAELRAGFLHYLPLGGLVGAVLLGELVAVAFAWSPSESSEALTRAPLPDPLKVTNTQALGHLLYTDYVFLFQTAGLILLVAMIGAILLTHRRRSGVRRQSIADQVERTPRSVELRKVQSGRGL
ncbi:NADH-quinone oxidoreductase subunit J [Magnetospirillum molischianum]|uniref:NADH-quinone oxidoreductase subunit J n=1 Tax=Magnetospirillum molischianum DSM 120 TaxID=1150626 RepID=H8FSL7_MAGML|nr:NADH-quinone oxidoreductase subunit J [Magnetospirillum molischianum]CCG41355.1 NADH-quinone oxidoreductase chain J (NADH dehydrogenase I, chain J) (NDH-1, chain J) [Magnetospirillum molischianum DSM 120]